MEIIDHERENEELKTKRICRFCLSQEKIRLSSIFARDATIPSLAPLTVQVMAIASIEVFTNDGMPGWICAECRLLFEHSYRFKQMCKRADTLLRQFPLTGKWPNPLKRPQFPAQPKSIKSLQPKVTKPIVILNASPKPQLATTSKFGSKKLLNADPAMSPEPPVPIRLKKEPPSEDIDDILMKFGNDEEISMDDIQRLIANAGDDGGIDNVKPLSEASPSKRRPKVLNKSSMRILNKEAEVVCEPRFSMPKMRLDEDGNVAMVTAILEPETNFEPPPAESLKTAEPVATDVYPCPHCERSFPLLQLRDIHMVNHTRERSFHCPDCDMSFFSKYDLQKHEVRHTGDKPFKCIVCEKGFSRATLLHRHERVHTDVPKFVCVYCEKQFISKQEMEHHSARHEKNRPFKCNVCHKTFAFKQGLERHELIHSANQPYPCQHCDQGFPTPSKLARHLTAHAGKRPYPCKYCSKSYMLSHHLSRHLVTHKQSTHICYECDKAFKTRNELIYHTAVHSTETLACALCQMKFESADEVGDHITKHIEGDAYACEFCDLYFLTADALSKHGRESHAADDNNGEAVKSDVNLSEAEESPKKQHKLTSSANDLQTTLSTVLESDDENDTLVAKQTHSKSSEKLLILKQVITKPHIKSEEIITQKVDKKPEKVAAAAPVLNVAAVAPVLNLAAGASSAKARKVLTADGQVKMVAVATAAESEEKQQPAQRRKVAVPIENRVENEETSLPKKPTHIEKVISNLPKSVSIRRTSAAVNQNKPVATMSQKPVVKTSTSPLIPTSSSSSQQQQRAVTRRSNEGNSIPQIKNIKTEQPTKAVTRLSTAPPLCSNRVAPASTTAAKTPSPKVGRPPKVKQVHMSKAEAESLAKQGRITFKNGNMILTRGPVVKTEK